MVELGQEPRLVHKHGPIVLVAAEMRQDALDGHDAVAIARIPSANYLGHATDVDSRQKLVLTEVDRRLPREPKTYRLYANAAKLALILGRDGLVTRVRGSAGLAPSNVFDSACRNNRLRGVFTQGLPVSISREAHA